MVSNNSKSYYFEYLWGVPWWSRWLGLGPVTSKDTGLTPAWEIDSTTCAVRPPQEKKNCKILHVRTFMRQPCAQLANF